METEFVLSLGDQRWPLPPGATTITVGRASNADIRLQADDQISRIHARLTRDATTWTLHDESRNGTGLNGHRLTTPTPLTNGDRIHIGRSILTFHTPTDTTSTPPPHTAPPGAAAYADPAGAAASADPAGAAAYAEPADGVSYSDAPAEGGPAAQVSFPQAAGNPASISSDQAAPYAPADAEALGDNGYAVPDLQPPVEAAPTGPSGGSHRAPGYPTAYSSASDAGAYPAEQAGDSPFPRERPDGNPFPAQQSGDSPFPAEHADGNPFAAEQAGGGPFAAQQADRNPLPAEHADGSPLPAEQVGGNPFEAEQAGGGPFAAEGVGGGSFGVGAGGEEVPAEGEFDGSEDGPAGLVPGFERRGGGMWAAYPSADSPEPVRSPWEVSGQIEQSKPNWNESASWPSPTDRYTGADRRSAQQPGNVRPDQQPITRLPNQQSPDGVLGRQPGDGVPDQQSPDGGPDQHAWDSRSGQQPWDGRSGQLHDDLPGQQPPGGVPSRQFPDGVPGQQSPGGVPGQQSPGGVPGQQFLDDLLGRQSADGVPGRQTGDGGSDQQPHDGVPGRQPVDGLVDQHPYDGGPDRQAWDGRSGQGRGGRRAHDRRGGDQLEREPGQRAGFAEGEREAVGTVRLPRVLVVSGGIVVVGLVVNLIAGFFATGAGGMLRWLVAPSIALVAGMVLALIDAAGPKPHRPGRFDVPVLIAIVLVLVGVGVGGFALTAGTEYVAGYLTGNESGADRLVKPVAKSGSGITVTVENVTYTSHFTRIEVQVANSGKQAFSIPIDGTTFTAADGTALRADPGKSSWPSRIDAGGSEHGTITFKGHLPDSATQAVLTFKSGTTTFAVPKVFLSN
ncbi:FHA domain-containing protein [Kribbella karoonensis]|uniref:FHA domain-containing protein n=1 Tax=Kribbella karoonensis TaxID=324851 RepID=A0ABP4QHH9_9ACTN